MLILNQKLKLFGTSKLTRLGFLRNFIISFLIAFSVPLTLDILNAEDIFESSSIQTTIATILFTVTLIIGGIVNVCAYIQRFHDLDKSGWSVLLTYLPILNILFFFYLLFMPSHSALSSKSATDSQVTN